jgi:DNA-binding NtrC family response regulator
LFRINTVVFTLPALRERPEDISAITDKILDEIRDRTGHKALSLSADAVREIRNYEWPGNIRELKNVLERSALLCRYGVIEPHHLRISPNRDTAHATARELVTLEELERRHILLALEHHGGHVGRAAQALGIARSSLYNRVRKLGIDAGATADATG